MDKFGAVSPSNASAPPIEPSLVDAAADVLDASGVAGLTISAIAEAAGVSRVTLHRRGASVDDYVVAVLARASDDLRSSLWPILTSSAPAAERLDEALAELCATCERHSGVMTAMFGVPARELPGRPGRTTSLEFIEPFAKLFADGRTDGSLVTDDPLRDATLIANTVCWTYLHMRRAHGWSRSESTRRVVSMATAASTAR
jgi:AcrR family transcriptional regulator